MCRNDDVTAAGPFGVHEAGAPGHSTGVNGGDVQVRLELPGAPVSVRSARRLVAAALQDWGLDHLEEPAVLLVSELVTNAVLHARTGLAVEVQHTSEVVRVQVRDGSRRRPQPRQHEVSAATGRGLGLLTAVACRWGCDDAPAPYAKTVWFELPVDRVLLPHPRAVED